MKRKPTTSASTREITAHASPVVPAQPTSRGTPAERRRRAEARLRERPQDQKSNALRAGGCSGPEAGTQRLLHELEVHQIELEMQNVELQKTRDDVQAALERYTDLFDFAPVGYFSIDDERLILEVNLTGAALLGVERSRLIHMRLQRFVASPSRTIFNNFLDKVFAGPGYQACEALILKAGGGTFWAGFRATSAVSLPGARKWCRVAFEDITARKQAEDAQRRLEALDVANRELKQEIDRRRAVEETLKQSKQHQSQLLEQSRQMQQQRQHLSHQLLSAQEEERKRISRELHDVIAQTLTSINVRLGTLKKEAGVNTKGLGKSIAHTQQLVEHSVNIVHRFARELRPTVLDDLGLIPALHAFMKGFKQETGIQVSLSAFAAVEQVVDDKRTVLYRVAQEALTNIARHAQASRAEVRIQKLEGAICMKIKDDGKGFPVERVLHAKKHKRLGLLGMRERVEMVNGNFTIESAPGKGTTIRAQIPFSSSSPREGGKLADGIR